MFERVWSTPQLPVRTWPASHARLAHRCFGHASLICAAAKRGAEAVDPVKHLSWQ